MPRTQRVKYRGLIWTDAFYLVLMGIFLLIGAILLEAGTASGLLAPLVTGCVLTVGSVVLLAMLAGRTLRAVTLDSAALRVPLGLRTKVIPVPEIAGVGLLYRVPLGGRSPEGWYVHVWDTGGRLLPLGKVVLSPTRSDRFPPEHPVRKTALMSWQRDWSLPLVSEDPGKLALSQPGQMATDIYRRVLERQGPTGPLAMKALQKLSAAPVPDYLGSTKAWWSPDGTLGRLPYDL